MTGFDHSRGSLASLAETAERLRGHCYVVSELNQELSKLRAQRPTALYRTASVLSQLSKNMDRYVHYKLSAPTIRATASTVSRKPEQSVPDRTVLDRAVPERPALKRGAPERRAPERNTPLRRRLAALALTAASQGISKFARWLQS